MLRSIPTLMVWQDIGKFLFLLVLVEGIIFIPSYWRTFVLVLYVLENKNENIGLLWYIHDTNTSFYVGGWLLVNVLVISAISVSIICTNNFDTSMIKLATELTTYFTETSRVIIKYQKSDCLKSLWMISVLVEDL